VPATVQETACEAPISLAHRFVGVGPRRSWLGPLSARYGAAPAQERNIGPLPGYFRLTKPSRPSPWRCQSTRRCAPGRRLLNFIFGVLAMLPLVVIHSAPAGAAMNYSGWESLGGISRGAPAATTWGPGRLDVFVRGADNALWHKWSAGRWTSWERLGSPPGGLTSAPAAVSWAPGRIDVFAAGAYGRLWHRWYQSRWSSWESLGGVIVGAPAVASWGSGRLDVFVRGADNRLWHKWYQAGWSAWESRGGFLTSSPAATSWAQGRIDVVVPGVGGAAYHTSYDRGWRGFESLGGTLVGAVGLSTWTAGQLDVYGRGTDNNLHHQRYAGGWSGWQVAVPGPVSSGPAAVSWAPGRIDVFASDTTSRVYHVVVPPGGVVPMPLTPAPLGGVWACIRQRESGGNYQENTGNGFYGAYQFTPSTWNESVIGAGYPQYANGRADLAPPYVQDAAAVWLQARAGWGPWPNTSSACGV
jgi:hypothetical protein